MLLPVDIFTHILFLRYHKTTSIASEKGYFLTLDETEEYVYTKNNQKIRLARIMLRIRSRKKPL